MLGVVLDVDEPPTKAGVYAVRAGVHVKNNLMHYLKQEPLEVFAPQGDFLRLFNLGDGNGIGFRCRTDMAVCCSDY